jgi:hypothetical protein
MKMTVFWVVAPCRLSLIALMKEAVQTSETLVNLYQCIRRYNPEDSHLLVFTGFKLKPISTDYTPVNLHHSHDV